MECVSCLCPCVQIVNEMNAGVIENCGKYSRIAPAGCICMQWPFESIVRTLSLKILQLNVICDTKTKDNVFVKAVVSVLYKVIEEKVPSAYYKLTDPASQIRSYVFDVIRSSIPRMDLDEAFASKETIAHSVKNQLTNLMGEFGYQIMDVLVTDLDPASQVKAAMNQINAESRRREALAEKAEAEKILQVKAAEAEAESKYLSGLGVARQRKAVVDGLRESVNEFSNSVNGSNAQDVMDILLVTQYFEMMKDIGQKSSSQNTIFLPHAPDAVNAVRQKLKSDFMPGLSRQSGW